MDEVCYKLWKWMKRSREMRKIFFKMDRVPKGLNDWKVHWLGGGRLGGGFRANGREACGRRRRRRSAYGQERLLSQHARRASGGDVAVPDAQGGDHRGTFITHPLMVVRQGQRALVVEPELALAQKNIPKYTVRKNFYDWKFLFAERSRIFINWRRQFN